MNVRQALSDTRAQLEEAGIDAAATEAAILVEDATGLERIDLFRAPEREFTAMEEARLRGWVAQRLARMPLQYIVGSATFYGRRFAVTPAVLIPRPETEGVVEHALSMWDDPRRATRPAADIGAGSGAIAITLSLERPARDVHAVDASADALIIAARNAATLGADRVRLREGDLFDPLLRDGLAGRLGLIVSNPPYIATREIETLPVEVRDFEPRDALDGGDDGLRLIRRLIAEAPAMLAPGGALVLELGDTQGDVVLGILRESPYYTSARLYADLGGRLRIAAAST